MTNHGSDQNGSANAPDWDAIARFLAGESPDAEAAAVHAWLESHPADRDMVTHLNAAAVIESADVDVEAALRTVHGRMAAAPVAERPSLTVERGGNALWARHRRLIASGLVAAAAVIVAFVSVRRGPAIVPRASDAPSRVYATAIGQRDSVTLADGSRVILGPDSHLMVPLDYGLTSRYVRLGGDAYFDVRHDATKPFAVQVGRALIVDVGTTFTVESDAGDTTSVSVLTGSVRLRVADSSPKSGAVLGAGDRGSLTADGLVHAYRHAAGADDAAWTNGRLVFHEASLARVAGEIHRWYGVTVQIADSSLAGRHVTASFNGESVDQVLKIVGLTLGARIDRQGDSAMVYSSRGPVAPR
jgi:transmembrane sensor